MRKNRVTSIITITAALFAFMAFSGCSKDKPNGKQAAPQALRVKTALVEARTVDRSVEATGTLHPLDEVIVSSEAAGIIERISVDLGDKVKAGQTLAVIDQREARLNLGDAEAAHMTNLKALEKEKARLEDARVTYSRYQELFKAEMVSASQHDSARTQFDVAAAQVNESEAKVRQSAARLDLAKKRLSDTVIKAPIAGEIKNRAVSTGEAVRDRTALFTVVSTGALKFRGTVTESAVPDITAGQRVLLTVEAFRDKAFDGRLSRLSPAVDAETRSLEIEALVPNAGGELKPGFFARGVIFTKKESGVPFVPEEAVYSFVGITKVFVIENGKAKERLVKTGVRDGAMIEVTDALKPGDTVAATNLSSLYDGADVMLEK